MSRLLIVSTDKHEFGAQKPDTTSANYDSSHYAQTLMSDRLPTVTETSDEGSNINGGGSHQPSGPDNGGRSTWQIAGKSLVILLVIFGLVWGGRWVWSNYSDDDSTDTETTEEVSENPEPLPINIGIGTVTSEVTESTSEPIPETGMGDDGDIPALGPADPLAMTVGAAVLAAVLYRSGLARQPARRRS